jgi:hypothetical protein
MAEQHTTFFFDVVSKAAIIKYREKVFALAGLWPSDQQGN